MTLDELVDVFNEHAKLPSIRKADIAGIRAVVLRLAEEMNFLEDMSTLEDIANTTRKKSLQVVKDRLTTEILASDGVDKAAGGSTREDERADSGSVILSDAAERIATPAAAPVCEWTQEGWEYRRVGCNGYGLHVYSNNFEPKRNRCPYCKWPVTFKSEAAR